MRRLTVGESTRRSNGEAYPSVKLYKPSEEGCAEGIKKDLTREERKHPVEESRRQAPPPRTGTEKKEEEHLWASPPEQGRKRKKPLRFSFGEFSPDKPLLRLGTRDIFAEDILLVLLIIMLIQDEADTELIAALVYILLTP